MRKKIVVSLCLVFLTGCFPREKADIPQEGEIVTWKQNNHLVVKAKLGPRRIHIPDTHCKRCEAEFYQPEHEHYLGQFPIDYVPEKFSKISVVEAESLPFPYSNGQLEFDLMLNGSTVRATDRTIKSDQGLDHPDQVKVRLLNTRLDGRTSDVINFRLKNKPNEFNAENSSKYGMQCWRNQSTDSLRCYGQSKHKVGVGVLFKNMGRDQSNWVLAKSWEPLYGGITIEWRIDKGNLHRWKEVDAAIWRLLETWNVSPISDSDQ